MLELLTLLTPVRIRMGSPVFESPTMPVNFHQRLNEDGTQWIPATLEEAVEFAMSDLQPDEREFIRTEGAESLHFSLGMTMRNEWKLWEKDMPLPKSLGKVGDDVSGAILREITQRVRAE